MQEVKPMVKDQLIKARCTVKQKQYLLKLMHYNKYKNLSEVIRALINSHMLVNSFIPAGGAKDAE